MLTETGKRELIDQIRHFPDELAAQVEGLSAEQLTAVTIPGEWCVQQIVHHLADSHMNSVIRLKLILTMDRPPLQGYPQELWAELADVRAVPIGASLAILRGLHRRWAALFENLPDDAWSKTGRHTESGDTSIEDLLRTYANHGRDHLEQIQRVLAAGSGRRN